MKIGQYLAKIWTRVYCAVFLGHSDPNINNHCISIREMAPQCPEVFQLDEAHSHTYPFYGPLESGLCPWLPGWADTRTNLDFTEARDSESMAVASAGPYAILHLVPDCVTDNHGNTLSLRFGFDPSRKMLCRCQKWLPAPQLCCHRPIAMLRLFCYGFAREFLFNPHFDLEPDYIIKPIIHRILRYIPHREILSTFHTQVDHRSVRHFCIVFTPKQPLPLRRSPPKSNTPIPSPIPLTTSNGIQIQSAVLPLLTCADRQMAMTNVPYQ